MSSADFKKAKPTPADVRAAARLKKIWLALPRDRRPTQDVLAEHWSEQWGGGTQSLISQYINGNIPLNIKAVMFFARELGCRPDEIYPELPGLDAFTMLYRNASDGLEYPTGVAVFESKRAYVASTGEEQKLDAEWASFSVEQKKKILELVHLAGVIGIATADKTRKPSQAKDDSILKQPTPGADLRRQRQQQRKRAGRKPNAS